MGRGVVQCEIGSGVEWGRNTAYQYQARSTNKHAETAAIATPLSPFVVCVLLSSACT
jgi:hypothetical protein